MADTLAAFHPILRRWFLEEIGEPTEIQRKAWPAIGGGAHSLIIAPTGTGKTLAAFLWAIDRLIAGDRPSDTVQVLYVSPLRALNNDIRRNLLSPLAQIRSRFERQGLPFPDIRVLSRSGDTPPRERQQMQRRPPSILITTPESLNILLTSAKNRLLLRGVATVILDEIHSILGAKRGIHLITAVDRLVRLSGEFQRIGLSATVQPPESAAAFLGGYMRSGTGYRSRPVEIIRTGEAKRIDLRVSFPTDARESLRDDSWWTPLIERFREIIRGHRSTLLFANSRRLTEKVARLINEGEDRPLAYSHHGSLSREVRLVVEEKLKAGTLAAIVATNSLELGIDIGSVDRVVMVQTPFSLSSTLQRVGRAGHQVGAVSRGVICPTHGRDFLDAAVTAEAVTRGEIEEIRPIEGALDVLAQVIASMTSVEEWPVDELYAAIRTSYPYHRLKREHFDLVIEMLAGRYAGSRIRELKPRISFDRIDGTVRARDGTRTLLYLSGGTIPDRGYYALRLHGDRAKIGELDEEFVWERSVGESFVLGNQGWRILKIDSREVEVAPARDAPALTPFWKAERRNRDFALAERVALFLEEWTDRIELPGSAAELQSRYHTDAASAEELLRFLRRQKKATGTDLPHRHHLVIEHIRSPSPRSEQVVLHTLWGGRVNQPFAIALAQAWEEEHGSRLAVTHDDGAVMLNLPEGFTADAVFRLLPPNRVERLLRRKLEKTGLFGARFREAAGTSLLLPRSGFRRRTPLWLNRLRAKKLLSAVMSYEDFPILLETWRSCLQDEFDLPHIHSLLEEIRRGAIRVSEVRTAAPSPFAAGLAWRQTNAFMYEDDSPAEGRVSHLREDFIREALLSSRLKPELAPELVMDFESRLRRTASGYSPATPSELLEWIKERLLIPESEWEELRAAVERDHGPAEEDGGKVVFLRLPGAEERCLAAVEMIPRLLQSLDVNPEDIRWFPAAGRNLPPQIERMAGGGPEAFPAPGPAADSEGEEKAASLVGEWLRCYGPVREPRLSAIFGFAAPLRERVIENLVADGTVLCDFLTAGVRERQICDAENLERMLYRARNAARPTFEARDIGCLPLFLAERHGLAASGNRPDDLKNVLEKLFGYPLPAAVWEREIFPSRLPTYRGSWLDALMAESDLCWRGVGAVKLTFCFEGDLDLFDPIRPIDPARKGEPKRAGDPETEELFPDPRGHYGFWDLADHTGESSAALVDRLWRLAWRGKIGSDAFSVVRRGIAARFRAQESERPGDRGSRPRSVRPHGFGGWKSSRPLGGAWYVLPGRGGAPDLLEREENIQARIRLLLERYGILFRELLAREIRGWRWADVFPSLRLMELSGELFSGHFFRGIPGLQFASPAAFRALSRDLDEDAVFWVNALDPISPCGIDLEPLKASLPRRLAASHLVYHGSRLVLVSTRHGSSLTFQVDPTHPEIHRYLVLFPCLLNREAEPRRLVRVMKINGKPALESPYAPVLLHGGFAKDYRSLVLRSRFGPRPDASTGNS